MNKEVFEIATPSLLSLALRNCRSRHDFVDAVLGLRQDAERFRHHLEGLENKSKEKVMKELASLLAISKALGQGLGTSTETMHLQMIPEEIVMPTIFLKDMIEEFGIWPVLTKTGKILDAIPNSAINRMVEYLYFHLARRSLLFFKHLSSEASNLSIKDELSRVFGSSLSNRELAEFWRLKTQLWNPYTHQGSTQRKIT